jgi:hypothetical protein
VTTYLRDLVERVGMTFGAAFGASLVLANWFTVEGIRDVSTLGQAGLAGAAAVLSLVKGLVATRIGAADSASLVPGVGGR